MITILTQRFLKFSAIQLTKSRKRFRGERLPEPDIYYFAYGANLDPERFEHYQMNAIPVGIAKLEEYQLKFSLPCEYKGKGYASIAPCNSKIVWGYLYKIDSLALKLLDIMEYAFLHHYKHLTVSVETKDRKKHSAIAYITGYPKEGLLPSTQYKKMILEAGSKHAFPEEYLKEIESITSQDSFELDPGFSLMIPSLRRPFERFLKKPYLLHDRLREIVCEKLTF